MTDDTFFPERPEMRPIIYAYEKGKSLGAGRKVPARLAKTPPRLSLPLRTGQSRAARNAPAIITDNARQYCRPGIWRNTAKDNAAPMNGASA